MDARSRASAGGVCATLGPSGLFQVQPKPVEWGPEVVGDVEYRDASSGLLAVGVFDDAGHRVIRVGGELDLSTVPALEDELDAAIKGPADAVVVDMSDLEFIDSTGIAVIVRAMGQSHGSERLKFVPSRAEGVNRVLEMTGVSERMTLADGLGS
jgi:anti-sigma B factor antagonist